MFSLQTLGREGRREPASHLSVKSERRCYDVLSFHGSQIGGDDIHHELSQICHENNRLVVAFHPSDSNASNLCIKEVRSPWLRGSWCLSPGEEDIFEAYADDGSGWDQEF